MGNYFICGKKYTTKDISALTQEEFVLCSVKNMPTKLYRYFSDTVSTKTGINHSIAALKNNTIYLQSPAFFDDIYDSTILLDEIEFIQSRLLHYAQYCDFILSKEWDYSKCIYEFSSHLFNRLQKGETIESIFHVVKDSKIDEELHRSIFALTLSNTIMRHYNCEDVWQRAFYTALHNEYHSVKTSLIDKFRIACFTTSPFLLRMWSSQYANNHEGFCVEYSIPPYGAESAGFLHNLLPAIYSDERHDITQTYLNMSLNREMLWDTYKYGLLLKSIDWIDQQEWRLISCDSMLSSDDHYNCRFFDISKVYLGNRMRPDRRREIIEICKEKNISYAGVIIAQDKFQMKECPGLCEQCPRLNFFDSMVTV